MTQKPRAGPTRPSQDRIDAHGVWMHTNRGIASLLGISAPPRPRIYRAKWCRRTVSAGRNRDGDLAADASGLEVAHGVRSFEQRVRTVDARRQLACGEELGEFLEVLVPLLGHLHRQPLPQERREGHCPQLPAETARPRATAFATDDDKRAGVGERASEP